MTKTPTRHIRVLFYRPRTLLGWAIRAITGSRFVHVAVEADGIVMDFSVRDPIPCLYDAAEYTKYLQPDETYVLPKLVPFATMMGVASLVPEFRFSTKHNLRHYLRLRFRGKSLPPLPDNCVSLSATALHYFGYGGLYSDTPDDLRHFIRIALLGEDA